jgi:hypothetical protein
MIILKCKKNMVHRPERKFVLATMSSIIPWKKYYLPGNVAPCAVTEVQKEQIPGALALQHQR